MGRIRAARAQVVGWWACVPWLVGAALVAGASAPAGAGSGDLDVRTIHLKAAEFDPLRGPVPAAGLPWRERHRAGTRGGYLVQFDHPITAADRDALRAAGASLHGYVPMMALEVVMTEAERPAVEAIPGVRWVGPVQAGHKLAPRLLAEGGPPPDASGRLRLRVGLYPDEDGPALAGLRKLGARLLRIDRGRSYVAADLEVPAAQLRAVAQLPLVRHVEPVPARIPLNDRAHFHSGLTVIADDTFSSGLDPALDGYDASSGFQVKYGHTDGGLWSAHPDFQAGIANGWISFEPGSDPSDSSGHGTHTAGSLVGDGSSWSQVPEVPPASGAVSVARWRGVQPEAALHHISFENEYTDRQIFERQAEEGAHLLSNSWGYADCPFPPFICNPLVDYDAAAVMWDEGVWDADDDQDGRQPLIVFFAAGNNALEGLDGCPIFGGADQINSPATAKNVITVGATETDRACGTGEGDHPGDVLFASSRGPVDPDGTGRGLLKPDVMAVGGAYVMSTERQGVGGLCDGSGFDCPADCSDTGSRYRYEAGTSMACPLAAGAGGVILQDLVVNLGLSTPSPSLVKALLVNGARDLEPSGSCTYSLDPSRKPVHQGWGRLQVPDSLYGPGGTPTQRNLAFEDEIGDHALGTGESYQQVIQVGGGTPLRVTLAWTDYPAAPGAGSPLVVNDLDLEVSGPEGVFLGNNFVGDWSVASDVSATPDRYNVVENVYLESAAGGSYTITVYGFQVSQDQEPDRAGVNQDFSLVWSSPSLTHPACDDGLDNDGDGRVDLEDLGCDGSADDSERSPLLPCDDGVDNDGDGGVDFDPDGPPGDLGCPNPEATSESPQCQDGLHNDGDGMMDFDGGLSIHGEGAPELTEPDPNCVGRPWHTREQAGGRRCGLGFELAGVVLVLARLHRRGRRHRAAGPRGTEAVA